MTTNGPSGAARTSTRCRAAAPFDGALGALAALECLRRLAESGQRLRRPVRAVVFSDEEDNYNPLRGSTAMRRGFSDEELAGMTGRDGHQIIRDRANDLGLSHTGHPVGRRARLTEPGPADADRDDLRAAAMAGATSRSSSPPMQTSWPVPACCSPR